MVKPSDLVRPPPPCPTPDKRAYRSAAAARRAHRDSYWSTPLHHRPKPKLWPYQCCCGDWHLTHHSPRRQAKTKAWTERARGTAPTSHTVQNHTKTPAQPQQEPAE